MRALIIQNANAYDEGVSSDVRDVVLRIWKERTPETEASLKELFEVSATKRQYLEGSFDPTLVSPDAWQHAQWGMDRSGNKEIQFILHANYGSNIECYEEWHEYFRKFQPPAQRAIALAEFEHPVQCCFVGLGGVDGLLASIGWAPYSRTVALGLLLIGATWVVAFGLYRTGRLWQGARVPETTTAVLYLPTVGGWATHCCRR